MNSYWNLDNLAGKIKQQYRLGSKNEDLGKRKLCFFTSVIAVIKHFVGLPGLRKSDLQSV